MIGGGIVVRVGGVTSVVLAFTSPHALLLLGLVAFTAAYVWALILVIMENEG